jgi:hypothetical protein
MPVKDPYWLVRSRSFLLEIPIFGEKSHIQQNIELYLFNLNSTIQSEKSLPSIEKAKQKSTLDLFEKKYGRSNENYPIEECKILNLYFIKYRPIRKFARL